MDLRRFYRVTAACALGLALGGRGALAAPLADDNEVQGSLAFSMTNGSDDGQLATTFQYGRYFTPWFELGLRQSFAYLFRDRFPDRWLFATEPFFAFLYNTDPEQVVVPYIGSSLGAAYNDNGITGVVAPEVGLKFFLNPQTYVGLAYDYQFFFTDVDDTFENGQHQVRAQFGFIWGGDRTSPMVAAAQRVEAAANTTEAAADKVDAAATKIDAAADQVEEQFKRGLNK